VIASRYRAWLELGRPEDLAPELEALLPSLTAHARRILRSHADAEDVVQDAVVELLRTRHNLPAGLALPVIMHRLVFERGLMQARSRRLRWRRESGLVDAIPAPVDVEPHTVDIDWLLARLSPTQRRVCVALAAGADCRQLAERDGTSRGRVATLLHRIRQRLVRSS